MANLADALRQFGAAYLATHALSTAQAKAWRGIVACRTAALGGQQLACDTCGHCHWQYHSCRNRHCPQCGMRAKDAWLQGRLAQVLDVPYVHLVFTLPFMVRTVSAAFRRNELLALEEAARSLGANFFQRFMGVLVPAVLPAIVAASLMVFTLSVGEFNLTWMLHTPLTRISNHTRS